MTKNDEIEGTLFWQHFTDESNALIQRAHSVALASRSEEEDGSKPLAQGRPLLVSIVINDRETGHRETQTVSLKGTIHVSEGSPECICSLRPLSDNIIEVDHIHNASVISLNGDSEEDGGPCNAKKEKKGK